MRKDLIGGGLAWALFVSLVGCAPEVSVTVDAPTFERYPGDVLTQVAGTWQVHAQLLSDCPAEWQHPFPIGRSEWRDEGDHLAITFANHAGEPLRLWPSGPQSLERVLQVQVDDCHASEQLSLVVDPVEGIMASGTYSSLIHLNASACEAFTTQDTLPDQCETLVHWQARRLASP